MPKPWILTRAAEASLVEIADWTLETFGPRQAAAYEDDLIALCNDIAKGTALSQGCRPMVDPALLEDIRFAGCGQHFVIFVEAPDRVVIVEFLHARSNLPQRLLNLTQTRRDKAH